MCLYAYRYVFLTPAMIVLSVSNMLTVSIVVGMGKEMRAWIIPRSFSNTG